MHLEERCDKFNRCRHILHYILRAVETIESHYNSLATQRHWGAQGDLGEYKHILRWLKDCSEREAYRRAMEKGDPDKKPLLGAEAPDGLVDCGWYG